MQRILATMAPAEEGFILDVLKYYTPISSYYKLMKTVQDDPMFDKKRAQKKLRAFVESDSYTISQKAEMMVEHFHEQVISKGKIGGQARAMVVTSSIPRCIEYYYVINKCLSARHSPYTDAKQYASSCDGIHLLTSGVSGMPYHQVVFGVSSIVGDLTYAIDAAFDGQQRFSSLTLLLMYLNNRLKTIGQSYNMIETMIFSESFGTKSFNINVDDRQDCMNAIFNDTDFDTTGAGESVKNLYGRYQDIQDVFPADITDDMLLHFCDWVAEKVFFIEIVATTEQDAHKVFVTMNDRGLSLTSTEMLKGYILSEIKSDLSREKMNGIWKDKVLTLKKDDDKGDETFIKAWLRAHYAETIRETKAGAVNKDFDIIGGSFHKWVRDERDNCSSR